MPGIRYTASNSEDDETTATGNDFFDLDPFKFLFSDEDEHGSVEESTQASPPQRKSKSRTKKAADSALKRPPEQRDPSESVYEDGTEDSLGRKRQQHYWRRNQPKNEAKGRRLGFGRKPVPKKTFAPSGTSAESSFVSDVPDHSVVSSLQSTYRDDNTRDDDRTEEDDEGFSSLMKALGRRWDPWDDQSSSSCSSRLSFDDTGTHDEESYLSARRGGILHDQPATQQQVQQVLVQYNPKSGIREARQETMVTSFHPAPKRPETILSEGKGAPSIQSMKYYAPAETTPEDAGSIVASVAQSQQREDCDIDEGRSRCLDLQKVCGVGRGKKKNKIHPSASRSASRSAEMDTASVFPKLRMVADEEVGGSKASAVVPADKKFNGSIPAHLQVSMDAFLPTKGPQSLYEYEHHLNPPRPRPGVAIVQVEASTISMTDCSIRRGEWEGKDTPPLPITPGVDLVGKIFHIDKDVSSFLKLSVGDRVISLTRCGGNSRFLSIDPEQLVKVSAEVDPAEAACLAETYLTAFQILHFGQGWTTRYRANSLKGKNVLVIGTVSTTLGHAFVELAMAAGVEKIIATSLPKHFPHLRSLGIIPVSSDPTLWYGQLDQEIDLVFVSNPNEEVVADHFRVLNDRGHLFVVGQRGGMPIDEDEQTRTKTLVCKRRKSKPSMIDRTHEYSPFRQWEQDLEKSKRDLSHLVKMLGKGEIKPNVLDRIPLGKVAKAQDLVESQRHPGGFLVCEPWLRNKKRAVRL
ncbi:alcohol dehydrogenase [Seminavis robusta]|uniref:Alcohol dehydrogenase n=1 Tax=Seminavis robusta TaxID=568900 RepID=A0A9N8DKR2_9STRA|nr:alcohol dehydrogenase [Seminavis robusta]|eukprot:Sro182_g079430.1 alcohol dehydrogenase (747) ;mRNA; f:68867-71259